MACLFVELLGSLDSRRERSLARELGNEETYLVGEVGEGISQCFYGGSDGIDYGSAYRAHRVLNKECAVLKSLQVRGEGRPHLLAVCLEVGYTFLDSVDYERDELADGLIHKISPKKILPVSLLTKSWDK